MKNNLFCFLAMVFFFFYITVLAILQHMKLEDTDAGINIWKQELPTSIYKAFLVNVEPGPK